MFNRNSYIFVLSHQGELNSQVLCIGSVAMGPFSPRQPYYLFLPFTSITPDHVSIALCLFIVYLTSRPTITRYTTARSYHCHVTALWHDTGYADILMSSSLLMASMLGVRRASTALSDYH